MRREHPPARCRFRALPGPSDTWAGDGRRRQRRWNDARSTSRPSGVSLIANPARDENEARGNLAQAVSARRSSTRGTESVRSSVSTPSRPAAPPARSSPDYVVVRCRGHRRGPRRCAGLPRTQGPASASRSPRRCRWQAEPVESPSIRRAGLAAARRIALVRAGSRSPSRRSGRLPYRIAPTADRIRAGGMIPALAMLRVVI